MNEKYNRAYRKKLRKQIKQQNIKNNDLEYYLLVYFVFCVFLRFLYYFQ